MESLRSLVGRFVPRRLLDNPLVARLRTAASPAAYWTEHNVTNHRRFASAEESLDHLDWRTGQYFDYAQLMPVDGHDGKSILDFGCGPGNDLVGFGTSSRPARLAGVDVAPTSVAEARDRVALHGIDCELTVLREGAPLPFADATFDYVASSGVLHHLADPLAALRELRRVLRPDGEARIMVYNYDSVFVHLYVPFVVQFEQRRYEGQSLEEAFRQVTDGPDCPISRWYRPAEVSALAGRAGFRAEHLGNATSIDEMALLPKRFDAMRWMALAPEHRKFLRELTLDARGVPYHGDQAAGIDGCYRLRPL